MDYDALTYTAQIVAGICYALALEPLRRWYEPAWTWTTVAGGVILVLGIVYLRTTYLPIPSLMPDAQTAWTWQLIAWSFVAAGVPIIAWQLWLELSGARRREARGLAARRFLRAG